MARPLRLEFPGALYHVTARGNARQEIYRDDVDRQRFLDMLGREIGQQGWLCYAYCLMSNHYHLLLETPEANLSNGMRRLNGAYGQMFNRRHDQVGHLFQGRYGSIVVDKDSYLLELCRYVVLNPVRAGVVKHPRQWRWSSYRATVGLSPSPHWLDSEWVLEQFGQSENKAPIAYSRFVAEGHGAPSPWHRLRDQVWLGNDQFLARMQDRVLGSNRPGIPLAQTRPARPDKQAILDAVSAALQSRAYRSDRPGPSTCLSRGSLSAAPRRQPAVA